MIDKADNGTRPINRIKVFVAALGVAASAALAVALPAAPAHAAGRAHVISPSSGSDVCLTYLTYKCR